MKRPLGKPQRTLRLAGQDVVIFVRGNTYSSWPYRAFTDTMQGVNIRYRIAIWAWIEETPSRATEYKLTEAYFESEKKAMLWARAQMENMSLKPPSL